MSDLIDRQEAIVHFQRIKESSEVTPEYNEGFVDGLDYCISFLSILAPTYPKKGKWIYIYKKGYPPYNYQCSECGAKSILFENYCSNCGAIMDKEREEYETD